jgi:para-aminobenzoate synthetase component I
LVDWCWNVVLLTTPTDYSLFTPYALKQETQTNCVFPISDFQSVKQKVLNWTKQFSTFCFLDNHQYHIEPHSQECMVAAGVKQVIKASAGTALEELQQFRNSNKGWLFGHLAYDLKNEMEILPPPLHGPIEFPDLFFFEPAVVIRLNEHEMIIEGDDPSAIFNEINKLNPGIPGSSPGAVSINQRLRKDEYISVIKQLQQHILRGDCYEINFCQEFFSEHAEIDPYAVYNQLSIVSPNPFSALYRMDQQWLICASPERFLRKQGSRILSQPIKGTSKRVMSDKDQDAENRNGLLNSAKDRSENVMVVDLVRNDLAKICREGTVRVDELYGIYSFPQVHQMISTVSGDLINDISFAEIIQATFPMGSMTGAPKKRVMELIAQYEKTKRGIFSGALGYLSPGDDFDFNVVIRSIMYNAATRYLSFQAGSGITFYSNPEQEWEECLVKAEAMMKGLSSEFKVP